MADDKEDDDQDEVWAEVNRELVEWMTETTSDHQQPRSDCG
jgi:hypothetical protein